MAETLNERQYGAGTHVGRIRENNEDSYGADPAAGLWLVADGMGGHQAGEVASAIVVEDIMTAARQGTPIAEAVAHSHQAVIESLKEGKGVEGMGSTVVALKMSGNDYEIAWAGDSRAYLWDGVLHQLTRDHTFVQQLLDAGVIDVQEARIHPQRNRLTQALGPIETEIHIGTLSGRLYPGEQILLCSDGLTGELSEEQIAEVLSRDLSPQEKADALIEAALAQGGRDNVTVLLIPAQVEKTTEPVVEETQPVPTVAPAGDTRPVYQLASDSAASHKAWWWTSLLILAVAGLLLLGWWLHLKPDG